MQRYLILYKPYIVLSQFSSQDGKKTLADFFDVPKDVYPIGRLDFDSEGLLLLTNDTKLNHLLLNPKHKHEREYWVQVEGEISKSAIDNLERGVQISIDGKPYSTLSCKAKHLTSHPVVPERIPPIRFRKNIPTSWLSLTLYEGKNRQVRRMTAKVGFPTLRLIRYRIESFTTDRLRPGVKLELSGNDIYNSIFNK